MKFKIVQEFNEWQSKNAKHHLRRNVRFFKDESNIEIFLNNPDEIEEKYGTSYEFVDLDGERVFIWRDDKVRVEITMECPQTNLEYEYCDLENLSEQKYKDFAKGEYIALVLDISNLTFSNEIFNRGDNYTVLGGCFGYDVEKYKKIISLCRLPNFEKINKPWEVINDS